MGHLPYRMDYQKENLSMNLKDSLPSRDTHLTEELFLALGKEERASYLTLLQEEIQYRKSKKILYYTPYEKQLQFHQSPAVTRAILGGNRSGKTCAGGMEFLFHVTGLYPKWYKEDNKLDTPVIGRIVAKDFQKGVGMVIIPFLEEWLDPSLVTRKYRNPIGIPVLWELRNGSKFDILTHEQDTGQFEGWRGQVAWFDEPPPRDKYIATLRGLVDYRGRNWLTLTPLSQPWIYDEIYNCKDTNRVFSITTDIQDNPHLSKEAIKEFEQTLTDEEKEARLHGRFLHLSGIVYKEFNNNIHICEPPQIKENWTRYFCIDPHPRTPTACLWLAVDPFGNHWVYDELWLKDMDIEQVSHAIHAQEGNLPPKIRYIDPAMDKDNSLAGGFNTRKELMKHGIYCQRASTDELGMNRIRMALKPRYVVKYGTEVPVLRISRKCTQTLYEFQHYIWAERKHEFGLTEKNTVKKANDHFMDCLKYIYNADPRYMADEVEEEVVYEGEYVKYPTKRTRSVESNAYKNLVEEKSNSGQF